jgi:hypothetical protein
MGQAQSGTFSEETLSIHHQIKIFRQIKNEHDRLNNYYNDNDLVIYHSLLQKYQHLVNLYSNHCTIQCPKVRFGRTELQMPILSCGGMRMQETWQPKEGTTLENINKDCQNNFEKIVDRAMQVSYLFLNVIDE